MLAVNSLVGSGKLTGVSIGQVSHLFPTYLTPAGFAFAIWGVIYTIMALLVVFGLTDQGQRSARLFRQEHSASGGLGWTFAGSNLANSIWIMLFTQNSTAAVWGSSVFIFGLLALLLLAYTRARCWKTRWSRGAAWPAWAERLTLDVGLSLYAGWLTVASIVNVACAAGPGGNNLAGDEPSTNATWAVVMLLAALLINAAVALRKGDPIFPLVLAWAANAIRANHHHDRVDAAATAVALCGLLLALSACFVRGRGRGNGSKSADVCCQCNAVQAEI